MNETFDTGEHAQRSARLTELLDAGHTPTAAEIEALLAADPEARQALEDARRARDLLADLGQKAPPPDFLRKVQRRLGRRTGGRFFHPLATPVGFRMSVEVFSVVAIVVIAACWFFLEAARPQAPGPLIEEPTLPAPRSPNSASPGSILPTSTKESE